MFLKSSKISTNIFLIFESLISDKWFSIQYGFVRFHLLLGMLNVFLNRLEYRSSNPTFFPKS